MFRNCLSRWSRLSQGSEVGDQRSALYLTSVLWYLTSEFYLLPAAGRCQLYFSMPHALYHHGKRYKMLSVIRFSLYAKDQHKTRSSLTSDLRPSTPTSNNTWQRNVVTQWRHSQMTRTPNPQSTICNPQSRRWLASKEQLGHLAIFCDLARGFTASVIF